MTNADSIRLMHAVLDGAASAEDKAALRLRRTIHKTMQEKKQQTIQ